MVRRAGAGLLSVLRRVPEPTLAGRFTLTFLFLAFWFALALHNNPVLFVICTVFATVLLSAAMTHAATSRLSIRRQIPERVFAGQDFDVRLRIENLSRWRPALSLGFRDALQVDEPGAVTCGPSLPVLPPRASAEVGYTKRLHRRGIWTITNSLAATHFPFGIFEQRVLIQSPARIVVLPALGRLHQTALSELAQRSDRAASRRFNPEGGVEFHSLREYRAGDDPRHIHWRTTARAGALMRRVLRDEAGEDLTILLDTFVDGVDAETRQRSFEKAVSCAATLLTFAARRRRRTVIRFAGGTARHEGSAGGLLRALEGLAGVESTRVPPATLVREAPLGSASTVFLISLDGPAEKARQRAAARGVRLRVWDVSHARFSRYFRK